MLTIPGLRPDAIIATPHDLTTVKSGPVLTPLIWLFASPLGWERSKDDADFVSFAIIP